LSFHHAKKLKSQFAFPVRAIHDQIAVQELIQIRKIYAVLLKIARPLPFIPFERGDVSKRIFGRIVYHDEQYSLA